VSLLAAVLGGCAATAAPAVHRDVEPAGDLEHPELARFMRELINVPFSFAMLERDGAQRPLRYHGAAVVLREAARDLVAWQQPPVDSAEARAVFYAYASHLERQVVQLELATARMDTVETGARLEDIRDTCNSCHRFFRPASALALLEGLP
jgi:hypothetical protein